MFILIAGLVIFLGLHSVRMVAPAFRENFIATRGKRTWKIAYSVLSLVGLILLIWGYGVARSSASNTFFYAAPSWLYHVQMLLMVPAMILITTSDLPAGYIKKAVKNPMLISVKIWAFAHLLVNGDLASLILFGTFLAWAILLLINTKRREYVPPASVAAKFDIIAVIGGLVAYVLFVFWLHDWLIGIPLLP